MVGIKENECIFSMCEAASSQYGSFTLVAITEDELRSSDEKEWGIKKRPNPGEFEVWDRRVP